jgi:hypothetical protein
MSTWLVVSLILWLIVQSQLLLTILGTDCPTNALHFELLNHALLLFRCPMTSTLPSFLRPSLAV